MKEAFKFTQYLILICLVFGLAALLVNQAQGQIRDLFAHTIAPEDRCEPYDRSDYPYSPSVENKIVEQQGGRIYSPYSGETFASIRETDIEHIVSLSEAHDSGMCDRSDAEKRQFANDLMNLTLASPSVNRWQKSGKDAGEWLPEHNKCWYVYKILRVKNEYNLTMDYAEWRAIEDTLRTCHANFHIDYNVRPAPPPEDDDVQYQSEARSEVVTNDPPKDLKGDVGQQVDLKTNNFDGLTESVEKEILLKRYDDNGDGLVGCGEVRRHGLNPVKPGDPIAAVLKKRLVRQLERNGVVCK